MANTDRIRVHIQGKEYSVVGGGFQDMLAAVKRIEGRRFMGELKVWQLPGAVEDIRRQLEIDGYTLEGGKPTATTESAVAQSPDRIRLVIGGRQTAVVGGSFQEMLAVVKSLPGRRFDGEAKMWEIPGDFGVIQGMIQAAGYQLEGAEKVDPGPIPAMEPPPFQASDEPPPYEPPDVSAGDESIPFEPPDWLDDDDLPPPQPPAGWWHADEPPDDLYDDEPDPFATKPVRASVSPPAASIGGDRIRIRVGGIPLVVTGGTFQDMLAAIKNIPGRRFDGQDKVWDIPADLDIESVKQMLHAAGFEVGRG